MPFTKNKSLILNAFFCLLLAFAVQAAYAQDAMPTAADNAPPPGVDVLPALSLSVDDVSALNDNEITHPAMSLTPDKSEIVRLDREAATVIVGNPAHLSILAENTKTLVLVPKAPGATYFTVLDRQSQVVMQRHVVVGKAAAQYMRVRKSCAGSKDANCQTTQVYYCPDMCHEIIMNAVSEQGASGQATVDPSDIAATQNAVPAETPAEVGSDNVSE